MPELLFRVHALRRMFERGITADEVRTTIEQGRTISDYPDDKPYPSRLILHATDRRVLHVVAADADAEDTGQTVIITVYEPNPALWSDDFTERRSP